MKLLLITLLLGASCMVQANLDEETGAAASASAAGGGALDLGVNANVDLGVDAGDLASDLGSVLGHVGDGLSAGGRALATQTTNFVQAIINFLRRLIEALVGAILGMLNAITEQIDRAEKALFDQVGLKRIGGFRSVVNDLGESLAEAGKGLYGGLLKVGSGLGNTLRGKDFNGEDFSSEGGLGLDVDVDANVGAHGHGKGKGKGHGKGESPSSNLE